MRRIKLPFRMEHWQFISLCLTVYDAAAIAFSYLFALLLRFDFQFSQIPKEYYAGYRKFMPFYIIICLILFRIMKLYRSIWRFASIRELENVFFATAVTVPLHVILTILFVMRMPISYYIIGGIMQLQFAGYGGLRCVSQRSQREHPTVGRRTRHRPLDGYFYSLFFDSIITV